MTEPNVLEIGSPAGRLWWICDPFLAPNSLAVCNVRVLSESDAGCLHGPFNTSYALKFRIRLEVTLRPPNRVLPSAATGEIRRASCRERVS